jgi:purine-binding chemotaxis protein CheW
MQTSALTRATSPLRPLGPDGRAGKYLIVHLGNEEFGVEVLKVREIMGLQDITNVPQMPPFVLGVINLRGKVVPVVDLRLKFGLESREYSRRACIVVVRTVQDEEETPVGMIVDGVAEVLTLAETDIEDTPDFGSGRATLYLRGMAKLNGRVTILLDIDRALSFT